MGYSLRREISCTSSIFYLDAHGAEIIFDVTNRETFTRQQYGLMN